MSICKPSRPSMLYAVLVFACCGGCGGPMSKHDPADYFADEDVVALVEAAKNGDVDTIDRLVAKGVDVNTVGKEDVTPLLWSLFAKNNEGFKRLLEHGADPNLIHRDRESVMSYTAMYEDSEYLRLALANGGDPSLVHPRLKQTPLFFAIEGRHKENLDLLIEAGADLNHQDSSGDTPMIYAASMNWYDSVYYLLEAGADHSIVGGVDYQLANEVVESRMDPNGELYQWKLKVISFLKKEGVDFVPIEAWAKKRAEKAEQHRKKLRKDLGRE